MQTKKWKNCNLKQLVAALKYGNFKRNLRMSNLSPPRRKNNRLTVPKRMT